MESLKELFKIGPGPSSSHTIGPQKAACIFKQRYPNAKKYKVTLYGSLSATGKGHFTDYIIKKTLEPVGVEIIRSTETLSFHPNGMDFEALDENENLIGKRRVFSIGGGALAEEGQYIIEKHYIYPLKTMYDIMNRCKDNKKELPEYVREYEEEDIKEYFAFMRKTMQEAIQQGLSQTGEIPGPLYVKRKAQEYYKKGNTLFAYALAVAEMNASCGTIVTTPTCGSAGVLPAVLKYLQEKYALAKENIIQALAVVGIIGNIVKTNGSISGAEVGCQGEIGVACAMAAGAATWLLGGTLEQIEYAAEIALEHHLGLTCDPVLGFVQIPCIERNAICAKRALDAAEYALASDGQHLIHFDTVVQTMLETGCDLHDRYRETAQGGLAKFWKNKLCESSRQ